MSAIGFKGISVRQTSSAILLDCFLVDNVGAKVTTGTTTLSLFELQSDGTLKTYDFNNNTFGTGTVTTLTVNMTHQTVNNTAANSGIWTYALSTLTGFTMGAMYYAEVNNALSATPNQVRKFQWGSLEGNDGAFKSGTVAGSPSTTSVPSNFTDADNFWNNEIIAFTSGTCKGLARKITAYANSGGTFTVGALTGTPSSGDTFLVIGGSN